MIVFVRSMMMVLTGTMFGGLLFARGLTAPFITVQVMGVGAGLGLFIFGVLCAVDELIHYDEEEVMED